MLCGFFLTEGKGAKLGKPVFASLQNDGTLTTYKVGALRGKMNVVATEIDTFEDTNTYTFAMTRSTPKKSKTYFINAPTAASRQVWVESLKEVKKYATADRKRRQSSVTVSSNESGRQLSIASTANSSNNSAESRDGSNVSSLVTHATSQVDEDEAAFDSGDEDELSIQLKSLDLKQRTQCVAARTMQLSQSVKHTKDTQAISECETWSSNSTAICGVVQKAPSISYSIGTKATSTKRKNALKRGLENAPKWEKRFVCVGLDYIMRYFLVKEVESINIANCKVILSEKKHEGGCDLYRNKIHITHKNGSQTLDLIAPTLQMCNNWVKGIKIATKHLAKKNTGGATDNFIVAKAWMFKRGAQMWTGWRRRYFVLHSTRELLYYETDTGSTLLGHIELGSHVVVKTANNHRDAPYPKGGIDIQTPGRTYKLCLETDDTNEVNKWISLLTESGMHYEEHIANLRKNLERKTGISSADLDKHEKSKLYAGKTRASSNPRPEYLALHRTQSAVVVSPLNSWQKWSGNVPIGVLSESPWSALIIAQSLQTPRHTHAVSKTGVQMSLKAKEKSLSTSSMKTISEMGVKSGSSDSDGRGDVGASEIEVTVVDGWYDDGKVLTKNDSAKQAGEKDSEESSSAESLKAARESHFGRNNLHHTDLPVMQKVTISNSDREWLQRKPFVYEEILALEEANKILREELAFAKAENQHLRFSNVRLQGALLKSVHSSAHSIQSQGSKEEVSGDAQQDDLESSNMGVSNEVNV
eukprot:g2151.t1